MMRLRQTDAFNSRRPVPPPPGEPAIAWRQGDISCGEISVVAGPLTEPDWDKVRAFLRRTNRESLRLRFGQTADFRDERTLRRFVDIDGRSGEMIWVLEEGGAICAMAHLVRLSPEQAEIALIVRSDRQRRGIGERLLRTTFARAMRHDLKTLTALVLYENTAMLRLARVRGAHIHRLDCRARARTRPRPRRYGSCARGCAERRNRRGGALAAFVVPIRRPGRRQP